VDVACWEFGELRHPYPDEVTILVIPFRLTSDIKVVDSTRCDTCCCIPIAVVGVYIVIQEHLFEVMGTETPVLL